MNKKELVKTIAQACELSERQTNLIVGATFDAIVDAIKSGDTVTVAGFGTFKTTVHQEKTGRNPKTGEAIVIPRRMAVKFSVGQSFKDAVKDLRVH